MNNPLALIRYEESPALPALREQTEALARIEAIILQMQAQIEQLTRAQGETRVTRTQEAALRGAIRQRAREIAQRESIPARAVSAAIRTTLREVTGRRAVGDIPQAQFSQALGCARTWDMAGAIRRIKRTVRTGSGGAGDI